MSGHWEDMYGNERKGNKDFIEGVIAGVEYCATWSAGKKIPGIRVVGESKTPMRKVIAEVREQLG